MFQITQSNDTNVLLDELIKQYHQQQFSSAQHSSLGAWVFEPFTVIVPSMVLGDWLNKSVARKLGISTLFTAQFWGRYQWQMIQTTLNIDAQYHPNTALAVPEVAVLSGSVMRWRLFGYLSEISKKYLLNILNDKAHFLHGLLTSLYEEQSQSVPEHRLWQVCQELSSVYVRYLTHRPEWLHAWTYGLDLPVSVRQMLADKERFGQEFGDTDGTPEWLIEQYENLEILLRQLWHELFGQVYAYRESLEERFWAVLDGVGGDELARAVKDSLPRQLYLFTVQQIPQVELQFLKRLSTHLHVHLFHLNPSQMFWADIVDKNWLATQQIIKPQSVYLKDAGHGLLSRLGKESRETFAMLADMSGGEFYYEDTHSLGQLNRTNEENYHTPKDWQVIWRDKFVMNANDDLLNQLKNDILMLDDNTTHKVLGRSVIDLLGKTKQRGKFSLHHAQQLPSISIHACHSLKRQLEIARVMIARYLNQPNADGSRRQLSDVVIYVPDIDEAKDLISLVFHDGMAADGLVLPAKITGATSRKIDELLQAILGFYTLLGDPSNRFYQDDVFEWLLNPMLYQSVGLTFEQMNRACELLAQAGFKRGFDAQHLSETLNSDDLDYRYSFGYALDRLTMGLLAPQADELPNALLYPFAWKNQAFGEAVVPLKAVSLADAPIIEALCRIYEGLSSVRGQYEQIDTVEHWLYAIEEEVINRYFDGLQSTPELRAIFDAKNSIAASIRANKLYQHHGNEQIRLSLRFVLESIANQVAAQAVSAEPANVISFARFGALRSIPFGLTIMLDMNLATFPRQDSRASMDLMKAGLRRRGDRAMEDDDNGAFLEALLCSRDACMIFYTAVASDGVTELLPASPVSELLEFFKNGVDWQDNFNLSAIDADEAMIGQTIAQMMPDLIEKYLVTHHQATSFDKALFYQTTHQSDKNHSQDLKSIVRQALSEKLAQFHESWRAFLPPAPLWQQIRQVLDSRHQSRGLVVTLPSDEQYQQIVGAMADNLHQHDGRALSMLLHGYHIQLPAFIHLNDIIFNINSPAKTFFADKIFLTKQVEEDELDEPLILDNLGAYQLQTAILDALAQGVFDGMSPAVFEQQELGFNDVQVSAENQQAWQRLMALNYGNRLPAGASRWTSLQKQLAFSMSQANDFYEVLQNSGKTSVVGLMTAPTDYAKLITACDERMLLLDVAGQSIQLSAKLPKDDTDVWLSVLPKSAKAKHLLTLWIHHLAWQVDKGTDVQAVQNNAGCTIGYFHRESRELKALGHDEHRTFMFTPVPADKAKRLLGNFICLAYLMRKLAIPMTVENSLIYVGLLASDSDLLGYFRDDSTNQLHKVSSLFSVWLSVNHQGVAYDSCSQHDSWRLILGDTDALTAWKQASILVEILYSHFKQSLVSLDCIKDDKEAK